MDVLFICHRNSLGSPGSVSKSHIGAIVGEKGLWIEIEILLRLFH